MKNSTRNHRSLSKGFTLIEILVTVSIMVVLMGMTFGIGKWALETSMVEKAKAQIKLMENRLEEYNADNGFFPPGDGTERSTINLFQDLYEQGIIDGTSKVYMPEFDPNGSDQFRSITDEGIVYDPFKKNKKPYYYLRGVDENGEQSGSSYNPDFDLWSLGLNGVGRGEGGGKAKDEEDDITNWD